ncbi:MAG: Hpt domain-containing protein [Arenibacterium sp.]
MTDNVIDRAVFEELLDAMGEEFATELVTTFFDEAPGMLAELAEAAANGEEDAFRRAAHSMKSNANVFGAEALAARARAFELDGLQAGTMEEMRAEYDRAEAALRELLDE